LTDARELSNGGKVEMAVGISVGVVVLLIIIAYAAVDSMTSGFSICG
jgi:uncharacterized protein (UPF0333 family)